MEITLQNKEVLSVDKASELELEQLNISLTKRIENWKFHPSVKKGFWNGYISYFKNNKWIPAGLWHEIVQICREHGFDLNINYISSLFDKNINFKDFEQWAYNYFNGHSITPRDYQVTTAFNVLQFRRCLAELATSSGKTLVAYLIIAYLLEKQKAEKILIIVPKISLVVQAAEDFFEYNWRNQTNIKIQQIYSGQKIQEGRNVVIGTYQSLTKKSKEYFDQFDAVFVDECLHPDTLITMWDGSHKKISEIEVGDWVKTTNDQTLEIEDRQVDFVYKNLSKGSQMYELEMEDGSTINITGNHKVKLSNGEYKRVDELNEDDDIISFNSY